MVLGQPALTVPVLVAWDPEDFSRWNLEIVARPLEGNEPCADQILCCAGGEHPGS